MTAATDCSSYEKLGETSNTKFCQQQPPSPLLPKESEISTRKRPLAIQELLEKKRARLAHQGEVRKSVFEVKKTETAAEEFENNKQSGGENCCYELAAFRLKQEQKQHFDSAENVNSEDVVGSKLFCCSTDLDDNETASNSSSGGGGCNSRGASESISSLCHHLIGHAPYSSPPPPNSSSKETLPQHALTKTPKNEGKSRKNLTTTSDGRKNGGKMGDGCLTPSSSSPAKCAAAILSAISPTSSSSCVEVCESDLSKSVPHNRIFAQVPGRLSLLSNVVKYKMTVGEVKRRLMGPESFNFSLLGALLRRAKMPEKSQMLVDELNQVGLSIPRGRRRLSQVTLLSALTEAESVQFANDFRKIADSEFPARQMAAEALAPPSSSSNTLQNNNNSYCANNVVEGSAKLKKLNAALRLTRQFMEVLDRDRSPTMENNSEKAILSDELQAPFATFSMLTHGFGNPAIQVGVSCFVRFLEHQIQMLEEQQQTHKKVR